MSHKTATVAHTIGIDTGKNTLHLIGLDDQGAIVVREKIARGRIAARFANVPRCLIGIEAGMATHYVARELSALGHDVKQVPPAYAKPFRQGHKNDFRDAHAIAEAVQRPSTRCVPVKTDDQLDLQALHRVRTRLIGQRTAVINQIRGFLLEHGIAVRQGTPATHFRDRHQHTFVYLLHPFSCPVLTLVQLSDGLRFLYSRFTTSLSGSATNDSNRRSTAGASCVPKSVIE